MNNRMHKREMQAEGSLILKDSLLKNVCISWQILVRTWQSRYGIENNNCFDNGSDIESLDSEFD